MTRDRLKYHQVLLNIILKAHLIIIIENIFNILNV